VAAEKPTVDHEDGSYACEKNMILLYLHYLQFFFVHSIALWIIMF
jgi:hypothetical protein